VSDPFLDEIASVKQKPIFDRDEKGQVIVWDFWERLDIPDLGSPPIEPEGDR
jgi:hypothetical protein